LNRYLPYKLMCCLIICSTGAPAIEPAKESLTFGVFPYIPTRELEQMYAPTAARFSEILNMEINLRTRPDFARFREQVRQQSYDIIFIQPFDYIRAAADSGYLPLAGLVTTNNNGGTGGLRAIFVVRADSTVNTPNDLEGRRVAIPEGAAVSLLGKHALSGFQLDGKIEFHSTNNHIACIKQVLVKKAAACITAHTPLEMFQKKTGAQVRVLYETLPIPPPLYAVHKRVPEAQRERLKKEILSWSADNAGDKVYLHGGGWSHLHPASDRDYDPVRTIWKTLNSHN